jgi:hypothetical protein
MFEDYSCAVILLLAEWFWFKQSPTAPRWMAAAWGYATGGMFVPFFAHLEAFLRGTTVRPDHPHTDVGSIVTKGIIWAICLVCLVVTVRKEGSTKAHAVPR